MKCHTTSKIQHAPNSTHILTFYLHHTMLISHIQHKIQSAVLLFVYDKALFSYWNLKLPKVGNDNVFIFVSVLAYHSECCIKQVLRKHLLLRHCFQHFKINQMLIYLPAPGSVIAMAPIHFPVVIWGMKCLICSSEP